MAEQTKVWRKEIKELENEKKRRLEKLEFAKKGAKALEEAEKNNVDILSNKMKKSWVDALLAWYGI